MKPSTPLLLILLPALAMAAPPAGDATQAPKQDLKDVRQQINALEKEVKAKEANRAEATDALRASEVAISEANRALATGESRSNLPWEQLDKVEELKASV